MKKIIILLAMGMLLGACTTMKGKSRLSEMSPAEKALERQNQRR